MCTKIKQPMGNSALPWPPGPLIDSARCAALSSGSRFGESGQKTMPELAANTCSHVTRPRNLCVSKEIEKHFLCTHQIYGQTGPISPNMDSAR